ncbi:hypothetical protein Z043_125820, partial [Scleropages formosus]
KTSVLAVEHTQFVAVRNKVVTPQQIRSASRSPPSTYKSNGTGQEVRGKGQEAPAALDKSLTTRVACAAVLTIVLSPLGLCGVSSWQTKVKVQDISPDYCVFPFKYKDHWYYSCTSVDSKHKRLWCSLTTDFDKDHLWGYCLGNVNFCKCHCHPLNQYHGKCFTQGSRRLGSKCQASGLADEPHSTAAKKAVPIHGPWALKMDGRKLCFFSLGIPEDE